MTGLLFALLQITALASRAAPSHTHALPSTPPKPSATLSAAIANDNRLPAGRLAKGAFTVDPAGTTPRKGERVLMLSLFADTITALGVKSEPADEEMHRELIPRERWFLGAINGRSWPHTERLTYNLGDTVRWRVIN